MGNSLAKAQVRQNLKEGKKKSPPPPKDKKSMSIQSIPMLAEEQDWRARDDFHVMMNAEEIRRDKKRLAAARAHGQKEIKNMSSVLGGSQRK